MNHLNDLFGKPISVYTTQQALDDGLLVKTGELMPSKTPVIFTSNLFNEVKNNYQKIIKQGIKLRLKGRGTRDYHYLINMPRLYVGNKYCPNNKYSVSFGMNKQNGHQLVVIDLDDNKGL